MIEFISSEVNHITCAVFPKLSDVLFSVPILQNTCMTESLKSSPCPFKRLSIPGKRAIPESKRFDDESRISINQTALLGNQYVTKTKTPFPVSTVTLDEGFDANGNCIIGHLTYFFAGGGNNA